MSEFFRALTEGHCSALWAFGERGDGPRRTQRIGAKRQVSLHVLLAALQPLLGVLLMVGALVLPGSHCSGACMMPSPQCGPAVQRVVQPP